MNDISDVCLSLTHSFSLAHTQVIKLTSLSVYGLQCPNKNGAKLFPKRVVKRELKTPVRTKTVHKTNKDIVHCRHCCQMLSSFRSVAISFCMCDGRTLNKIHCVDTDHCGKTSESRIQDDVG